MTNSFLNHALSELRNFDTPSITNIAGSNKRSYPLCLNIYDEWTENWYTDQSIRCMYPELGPTVGYAVTCTFGMPEPNGPQCTFMDVVDALDESPKPSILIVRQDFPPEIENKVGLSGENMTAAMKAVGCVGALSNGPSRDIDAIRPMKFQYMISGVTAGHGDYDVLAVNVPVSIAGMDVIPGDVVHMDENGACKIPAGKIDLILTNLKALLSEETARVNALRGAKTAAQVRAIFAGES